MSFFAGQLLVRVLRDLYRYDQQSRSLEELRRSRAGSARELRVMALSVAEEAASRFRRFAVPV